MRTTRGDHTAGLGERAVRRSKSKFKSAREAWHDVSEKTGMTPKNVIRKEHTDTEYVWVVRTGKAAALRIPGSFSVPSSGALEAKSVDVTSGEGPREFEMEAYTGSIFDIGFGPAVVEIASLHVPADGVPMLRQHNWELFIGRSSDIDKGPPLKIRGTLFQGVDEADEIANISDQGGQWQASIGFGFSLAEGDVSFVAEGETAHVNGRFLAGPFLLLKNANLKEGSFVPLGADSNTSAIALGDGAVPPVDQHLEVTMSTPNSPSFEDEQKRIADITSAFPDEHKFALSAITGGLSLTEAKLKWTEKLEAKLAEQTKAHEAKLAELEASHAAALEAAKKPDPASPAAVLSGFAPGGTGDSDAASQWDLAVAKECKRLSDIGSTGMQRGGDLQLNLAANIRAKAADNVAKKNPNLHQAYLQAFNAAHAARRGR